METKTIHVYGSHELSADGKRNSFNVCCHLNQQYKPYAACLNLIKEQKIKGSRFEELYADCFTSISKRSCPAVSMREEELEKGTAVYFTERNKFAGLAASAASFLSSAAKIEIAKVTPLKSKSLGKSSVIDRIDTGDYTSAINAEIKRTAVAAAPVAPVIAVEAKQGESLLAMARRLMKSE